jgi:hypothetical protein
MKLSIIERLIILNNLPKGASIENLIALPMIREKVEITSDEAQQMQIKTDGKGGLTWNEKKAKDKEVHFGKIEKAILKKQFEFLSEAAMLPDSPATIGLYCKLTGASLDALKESVIEDNQIEEEKKK